MRKNTARHWLHAGLDLLPLILIPVFMIYSHRHTIDSGSIEVPVNKVVDFNQIWPGDSRVISDGGLSYFYENNNLVVNGISTIVADEKLWLSNDLFTSNHIYIVRNIDSGPLFCVYSDLIDITDFRFTYDYNYNYFGFINEVGSSYDNQVFRINIFDLTQMFGAGNEPTIEQFNIWFPNEYYSYTLSSKQLIKGYSTQTYDDTDIMSQFTYQMYNAVDKYFNMGNVFGMSNVYDWFNLNIFGGNASISIYIVWNIVLYEFVMDLLFLLYALFMWFIDVTKRLIEKPLNSIK